MFANNSYAKVWQIQPKKDGAKSLNIQLSTSFKNKQTNQYEVDFPYQVVASCLLSESDKLRSEIEQIDKAMEAHLPVFMTEVAGTDAEQEDYYDMETIQQWMPIVEK